ncbi:hypothetical protein ACF0H5_006346 [Mactra antiquata]
MKYSLVLSNLVTNVLVVVSLVVVVVDVKYSELDLPELDTPVKMPGVVLVNIDDVTAERVVPDVIFVPGLEEGVVGMLRELEETFVIVLDNVATEVDVNTGDVVTDVSGVELVKNDDVSIALDVLDVILTNGLEETATEVDGNIDDVLIEGVSTELDKLEIIVDIDVNDTVDDNVVSVTVDVLIFVIENVVTVLNLSVTPETIERLSVLDDRVVITNGVLVIDVSTVFVASVEVVSLTRMAVGEASVLTKDDVPIELSAVEVLLGVEYVSVTADDGKTEEGFSGNVSSVLSVLEDGVVMLDGELLIDVSSVLVAPVEVTGDLGEPDDVSIELSVAEVLLGVESVTVDDGNTVEDFSDVESLVLTELENTVVTTDGELLIDVSMVLVASVEVMSLAIMEVDVESVTITVDVGNAIEDILNVVSSVPIELESRVVTTNGELIIDVSTVLVALVEVVSLTLMEVGIVDEMSVLEMELLVIMVVTALDESIAVVSADVESVTITVDVGNAIEDILNVVSSVPIELESRVVTTNGELIIDVSTVLVALVEVVSLTLMEVGIVDEMSVLEMELLVIMVVTALDESTSEKTKTSYTYRANNDGVVCWYPKWFHEGHVMLKKLA